MKIFSLILISIMFISCSGKDVERISTRKISQENLKEQDLRDKIFALQGVISQIQNFIASDFSSCSNTLPVFEQKICKIAQTANAEQQAIYAGQIQLMLKMFQTSLYGEDCTDEIEALCPKNGSIFAVLEDITDANDDITDRLDTLETDVAALTTDVSNLEARLDDFNGTGQSIETVISGINVILTDYENRISSNESAIDDIQAALGSDIYKTIFICVDIFSSGPVYEPALIRGDNQKMMAYISTSTQNGMGVLSEAGITGNIFGNTEANTRRCNFRVYDLTSSIKMCWNNTNRTATSASIDTVCDYANSFASPTSACTCAN